MGALGGTVAKQGHEAIEAMKPLLRRLRLLTAARLVLALVTLMKLHRAMRPELALVMLPATFPLLVALSQMATE
eukprot:5714468-Alexandrium_andersonii.AAC.1